MKTKLIFLLAVLLLAGLAAGAAWAMSSANYRMDWYEIPPGTGALGRTASANAVVYDSFGPFGVISMSSSDARLRLGYWAGAEPGFKLFHPLQLRRR
jgi:hypothetical protein